MNMTVDRVLKSTGKAPQSRSDLGQVNTRNDASVVILVGLLWSEESVLILVVAILSDRFG